MYVQVVPEQDPCTPETPARTLAIDCTDLGGHDLRGSATFRLWLQLNPSGVKSKLHSSGGLSGTKAVHEFLFCTLWPTGTVHKGGESFSYFFFGLLLRSLSQ